MEALSLREVSRRTGVSHAAAYNHFRDKASLLGAVVDDAFVRLATDLRAARERESDPAASLAAVGVAYVRFAYCNRAEFKIMFRPEMCSIAILGPDEPLDAYAVLVDAIVACQRSGAIAPGPPQPLVLAAWSLVHGLAALIVDGPDRGLAPDLASAEALAMSCVSTLAEGLRMRLPLRAPE